MLNEDTIMLDYIQFAKKFGIILKDERYLEWEFAAVVGFEHSFKHFDDEMYKNKDSYCGNFDILDEILLKICPNILPLQYKLLYKNCVNFGIKFKECSCGYYNDNEVYYIRYQCDIKKLYNFLVTNKLFSEEEL
jgi:hypothetical protein